MGLAAVGLLWLSRVGAGDAYLVHVLGPLILVGLGFGTSFVPMTLSATAGVPPHEAGLAAGLINTTRQVGGALGLAIMATVASSISAHDAHRPCFPSTRRRPSPNPSRTSPPSHEPKGTPSWSRDASRWRPRRPRRASRSPTSAAGSADEVRGRRPSPRRRSRSTTSRVSRAAASSQRQAFAR
jgi:hypothetical protein